MIKYLAIIRRGNFGTVLNVASGEIRRVVATDKAAGSIVIGEYNNHHDARRAMLMGLRGYRRRFNPLSDPRFKQRAS